MGCYMAGHHLSQARLPPTAMLLPLLRPIARCQLIWSASVSIAYAQIM
jgi:hypothetical protein